MVFSFFGLRGMEILPHESEDRFQTRALIDIGSESQTDPFVLRLGSLLGIIEVDIPGFRDAPLTVDVIQIQKESQGCFATAHI